jgi:hypothetical protein
MRDRMDPEDHKGESAERYARRVDLSRKEEERRRNIIERGAR